MSWQKSNGYYDRGRVVVTHDPSGTFARGARFNTIDIDAGIEAQAWPPGIRFRWGQHAARMMGAVLMRDDRLVRRVRQGVGRWAEIDAE